jgi:hypothetical protein
MCAFLPNRYLAGKGSRGSSLPVRSLLPERSLLRAFLPYQERSGEAGNGSKGSRSRRLISC